MASLSSPRQWRSEASTLLTAIAVHAAGSQPWRARVWGCIGPRAHIQKSCSVSLTWSLETEPLTEPETCGVLFWSHPTTLGLRLTLSWVLGSSRSLSLCSKHAPLCQEAPQILPEPPTHGHCGSSFVPGWVATFVLLGGYCLDSDFLCCCHTTMLSLCPSRSPPQDRDHPSGVFSDPQPHRGKGQGLWEREGIDALSLSTGDSALTESRVDFSYTILIHRKRLRTASEPSLPSPLALAGHGPIVVSSQS